MGYDAPSDTYLTTHPTTPAPSLRCPICLGSLDYRQTIAGTGDERWDYYECRRDGPFQYAHHTGVLRGTTISVEQLDPSLVPSE